MKNENFNRAREIKDEITIINNLIGQLKSDYFKKDTSLVLYNFNRDKSYLLYSSKSINQRKIQEIKNNKIKELETRKADLDIASGSALSLIEKLLGGVRSGMTYGGAKSIKELQRKAEFVAVSPAYIHESHPRQQS